MSAEVVIGPALLDLAILIGAIVEVARHSRDIANAAEAALEAGEAYREMRRLKTSDGKIHEVVGVFTDGVGRNAGVRKIKKGYEIVVDPHGLTPEQKEKQARSVRLVFQRYVYRKVLKELKNEGYEVAEEKVSSDSTIRLVVRKTSSVGKETQLESTIAPDGAVKMELKGMKGPACVPEAQKLADALGEIKSQNLLPEYYEQASEKANIKNKPGA